MNRSYAKLSTISIRHAFYTAQACPDFDLTPTIETKQEMTRYRLVWGSGNKTSASDFSLMQQMSDGQALIPLPSSFTLRYFLTLKNPNLPNLTALPDKGSKEVYFWQNQAGSATLEGSVQVLTLVAGTYEWTGLTLGTPSTPTTATATNLVSGEVKTAISKVENGIRIARINLEGSSNGVYQLSESGGSVTKRVYLDRDLFGQDVFGIIELRINGSIPALAPAYSLNFTARQRFWTYFLVKKGNHSGYLYEIKHEPPVGAGLYNIPRIASPIPADAAKALQLSTLNGGAAVDVYKTTAELPYQEAARSFIKLGRKPNPGPPTLTYLISHLPNAALDDPLAYIVVPVDPPNP